MSKIDRIVFWEPCISPHKSDLFAAIVAIAPDIEVIYCADSELSKVRIDQGWCMKSTDAFRIILAPSQIEIDLLVSEKIDTTLHIFSGIRWIAGIVAGLKTVKRKDAKFAIMSEPRVREGWKGILRFLHSWLTEGWLRNHASFILGIGRNGPPWFSSVGYPKELIFPYAYFVDPPSQLSQNIQSPILSDRPVQIGYVGRLVKMKGVFDVVSAVAKLGPTAQLSIVGNGPEEHALKVMSAELELTTKFMGVLPMQEVGCFMRSLDVLVLASISEDDGWGVVVSEALMCGIAAIVTPTVGVSVVVNDKLLGRCVPAGSPNLIADAVREMQLSGAFTARVRAKREALARSRLSAERGAGYLMEIIRWRFEGGERPIPFYETL